MIVTPPAFVSLLAPAEAPQTRTFAFRGNQLLVREHDLALPDACACEALGLAAADILPVGRIGEAYCRAVIVPADAAPLEGYAFRGMRGLFGRLDEETLAIAGRAFQIADWARTHRFCGACGGAMARAEGERAMKCGCGHVAYPRIAPAMMVLVRRGPAILLARNVAVPAGGRMSALAGFVEPGESIEDAIHREVREEVGIEVTDTRYFASQSWPYPHALMIAFTAEYAGGELRCEPAEIAEARWFGPGDPLPELSPPQSISRALIDAHLPSR
ncbi:MAG TPA: NAD(+) diphosphatase [Myxococcota bacterium]|nr:NAD(+) diphosphatase [Myxococcota bacterium]